MLIFEKGAFLAPFLLLPYSYIHKVRMKPFVCFVASLFPAVVLNAQTPTPEKATGRSGSTQKTEMVAVVEDGDTMFVQNLRSVSIYSSLRKFNKPKEQKAYNRLVYNVRKVYPYAHRAGVMLKEEEAKMVGLDKGDRRSHMKKVEKRLESEFGPELKSLNFTQGRILLKLIDRETGQTSYSLVDDLRGSFRAWFYDGIAGLFGYDLKSEYNPHDHLEDRYIEEVVHMIEAGELTVVTIGERKK